MTVKHRLTTLPAPPDHGDLVTAARQAANVLYNIPQSDRPLTERARQSCRDVREALDSALRRISAAPEPIDMILHCPKCGLQHIDKPVGQFYPGHTADESAAVNDAAGYWNNPSHRSHLCHGCGFIWRPADVPTNGVAAITTKGTNDSPPVATRAAGVGEMDRAILVYEIEGALEPWGRAPARPYMADAVADAVLALIRRQHGGEGEG